MRKHPKDFSNDHSARNPSVFSNPRLRSPLSIRIRLGNHNDASLLSRVRPEKRGEKEREKEEEENREKRKREKRRFAIIDEVVDENLVRSRPRRVTSDPLG